MITLRKQQITPRLQEMRDAKKSPIVNLDYKFNCIPMAGGVEFIKSLVDSGKLFEYESYLFQSEDGKVFSNIQNRPYVFDTSATGEVTYKRYKNLITKPHGIVTCALWNKTNGYFKELVDKYPELVPIAENFFKEFNVDRSKCNQICLVYLDKYLPYHIDFDYLFAIRLNISHSKYLFKFKNIPDGQQQHIVKKFLYPEKDETYDELLSLIKDYSIEHTFDENQTGQTFIIDSYNYLHDFIPETDSWIMSINLEKF